MRVTAVSGSPNGAGGNTELILGPFLEGLEEAGAELERFYTRKLRINPCYGELHCWLKTPGKCFQRDDMEKILHSVSRADLIVLATPLYVDGMSGPLKNVLDRLIPLVEPRFAVAEDRCIHPLRAGVQSGDLVLVSSCAFWDVANFSPLVHHVRAVARNFHRRYRGALLRPHAPVLRSALKGGLPVQDVLAAAREAGRGFAEQRKLYPEALKTISRELMPREKYLQMATDSFEKRLKRS